MTQSDRSALTNELIQQLTMLGLSDNEARSYATLLRFGPLSGYEVARHSGIARGNVYACLGRLLEKQAITRTSEDRFLALPLAHFVALQHDQVALAARRAEDTLTRLQSGVEEAQVVSIVGTEPLLQRCTTILHEAQHPIFLAAFPSELETLAPALQQAQQRHLAVEAIAFGTPPQAVPYALEHCGADEIRAAQQGQLLLLAAFPHGVIGFCSEQADRTTGLWAWNRYLATVIGLYVTHERFTLQLWPRLPEPMQQALAGELTDVSSRIALAGLRPQQPLRSLLEGTLTPAFDHVPSEEECDA